MPDIQTALKNALDKTLIDKLAEALDDWDDEGAHAPAVAHVSTPPPPPPPAPEQPVSSSFPSTSDQKPIMTNRYNITNNVSRETFNYIKNNPGSTRKEIITELNDKGFAKDSVSSLIAQMRKSGMVHDTGGLWYADVAEYQPIKNQSYAKKKAKAQAKKPNAGELLMQKLAAPKKADAGIAALRPDTTSDQTPPIIPTRKGFVSIVRNRDPHSIIENMTVYQARELYDHLKQLFGG